MIDFILEHRKVQLILPVNPPNLAINRQGNNEIVDIVELGEIVVPRKYKLSTITIESYFPAVDGRPITEYINFIMAIWASNLPLKFIVTEMYQEDIEVLIQNFNYDRRAGEHTDIYYTLELIEYIPYGARIIPLNNNGTSLPVMPERSAENKPPVGRTYAVLEGDTLCIIAKKLSGNTANWRSIYDINKQIIGNDYNLVVPGSVLSIPEVWTTEVVSTTSSRAITTQAGVSSIHTAASNTIHGGGGRSFASPEMIPSASTVHKSISGTSHGGSGRSF